MPTFYKYAKREADNYVDWAKIGKDMSLMISKENEERETKKEALNQATRKTLDDLANAPMGENEDVNGVMSKAANDAIQYVKMQEKLFKSGRLKYSDYIHNRQNINDGYKNLFGVGEEIQKDWAQTQERLRTLDASITEAEIKASMEGLADMANTRIYINPVNGMVSVAKTKEETINGQKVITMDSDPSKMYTVNELRNYSKAKLNRFKTEALDNDIERIGLKVDEFMTQGTLSSLGRITSVSDPALVSKLNPAAQKEVADFDKFTTDLANVHIDSNPFEAQSILRDYVGNNPKTNQPYTWSFDKAAAQADPNVIYFEKKSNGTFVPVLSDEQKEVARTWVKRRIYNEIDQKREVKGTQYRPDLSAPFKTQAKATRDQQKSLAAAWAGLYTAKTIAEKSNYKQSVIGIMRSLKQDVSDIQFSQNGKTATIIYGNGATRPITVKDDKGNPVPIDTFIRAGSEFTGDLPADIINSYKGKSFGDVTEWNKITGGIATPTRTTTTTTVDPAKIKASIPNRLFLKSKTEVLRQLPVLVKDLGLVVEDPKSKDNPDDIVIKDKSGKILATIETNRSTMGRNEESLGLLLEAIDAAP